MWAFGLYAISFVVFLAGLHLLHVPDVWLIVSAVVVLALGAICAITHLRGRSSESQEP